MISVKHNVAYDNFHNILKLILLNLQCVQAYIVSCRYDCQILSVAEQFTRQYVLSTRSKDPPLAVTDNDYDDA